VRPGLDTSGNHAAKPDPATSTTSSGFRVPYLYLWLPRTELLFNDGPTRRTSSNVFFIFIFAFMHIREIKISGARGLYTAHLF